MEHIIRADDDDPLRMVSYKVDFATPVDDGKEFGAQRNNGFTNPTNQFLKNTLLLKVLMMPHEIKTLLFTTGPSQK